MEPQLIDYYNEEPHGVHVIDKLNEEYEKLSAEKDKLQKQYDSLKHNHDVLNSQIRHLILPCIPNKELIEEFQDYVTSLLQSIEDDIGTDRVLNELCNSMTLENELETENSLPTEAYFIRISLQLNEVTGEKNFLACKRYIRNCISELTLEHINWICPVETIIEKIMEDLYYWFDICDSEELILL
jgi:hypothetical protein